MNLKFPLILPTILKISLTIVVISSAACQQPNLNTEPGLYAEFVTSNDTMLVKLHHKRAPLTVANFVALSEGNHPLLPDSLKGKPYYNGSVFHRVINQFMIQGGDPSGNGTGSPGYKFEDEFHMDLNHNEAGVLSMANPGPSANGSQFFITEVPTPHLNDKHSVFGKLIKGFDVLDSISNVKVNPRTNKPLRDVVLLELNILRVGSDAKRFNAPKIWNKELPAANEKLKIYKIQKRDRKAKEFQESKIKAEKAAKATADNLSKFKSKSIKQDSGLLIYFIQKGNGLTPTEGQELKVVYEGYFENGQLFGTNNKTIAKKFGSFDKRKEIQGLYNPISVTLNSKNQMISGFKEGLSKMKIGDKTYLYMPSKLAYGNKGSGPIKPNTNLVFIVEIVQ